MSMEKPVHMASKLFDTSRSHFLSQAKAMHHAAAAKEQDPEQRITNQQSRINQALQAQEISRDDATSLRAGVEKIRQQNSGISEATLSTKKLSF